MTKTIFGLCGIPRAGNTIFATLMNQNPNIAVTGNSVMLNVIAGLESLKKHETFQNFPDHKSLDNITKHIAQNYYKDWKPDYIIDRSAWGMPDNLKAMKKYVNKKPKIICLTRDIIEVLASFIKFSYETKDNYISQNGRTLEQRCNYVMGQDFPLHMWLRGVWQCINGEAKKYSHVIKYNDLIKDPQKELDGVYKFLGLPKYKHKFTNIKQLKNNGVKYDDKVLGDGLHRIKTKSVSKSTYTVEEILTPEIIARFDKMNFW